MEHSQDAQTFPTPDQLSVLLDKYRKHPLPGPIVSAVREGGNGVMGSVIQSIKRVTHQFVSLLRYQERGSWVGY